MKMCNPSIFAAVLLLGGSLAQIVGNQQCINASQVAPGDFLLGSTVGLITNQNSTNLDALLCGDDGLFQVGSPGLWYYYRADVARDLRVSTCSPETNFENRITVFFLQDANCLSRQCIGSSVGEQANCPYGNGTAIDFSVVPGLYAFVVQGEFQESVGDFGISIFDQSEPSDSVTCETAMELSHDQTLQGSTVGAEYHDGLLCDTSNDNGPSNPGVFFKIPPVSRSMGISISLAGADDRAFDVRVYSGACDELKCTTVNTKILDTSLTVSWMAELDEGFYVYVSASSDGDDEVTDRFGILMVQEDPESKSSPASVRFGHVSAFLMVSTLLSVALLLG
jgi:hypothetical protein